MCWGLLAGSKGDVPVFSILQHVLGCCGEQNLPEELSLVKLSRWQHPLGSLL